MANIVILGAGLMGTAISVPLSDNGHRVRLVGTHLDSDIIEEIHETRVHPRLRTRVADSLEPYTWDRLGEAMEGVDLVVGVFVMLEKPIDFGAVDRQPVDIAFSLFAPEEAGVEHLKALALVSRTLREPSICAKLRANPDPATLYAILTETQPVQAA